MSTLRARFFVVLALASGSTALAGDPPQPVTFDLSVEPTAVEPGSTARVRLQLALASGVKLNKYPKVRLKVPAQEGLVRSSEGSLGTDKPPSIEDMEAGKNYFEHVDPLEMTLEIDPAAVPGAHEVTGKLRVNYCITATGICRPGRIAVKIPITVL